MSFSEFDEIESLEITEFPAHIEVIEDTVSKKPEIFGSCPNILPKITNEDDYLYFGQSYNVNKDNFNCKVVIGGTKDCLEGALSNVLGASLARKHEKYIGVFSEAEFMHDINVLGNININNSGIYFVRCGNVTKKVFVY